MSLTTEDIAVLAAIIILSPDREGLKYPEKVEQIQIKLLQVMSHANLESVNLVSCYEEL